MPALLQEVVAYCDQVLNIQQFDDYCPNGLQVEASTHVNKVVSGVTASLQLIEAAVAHQADLLLVHHGYFWRGEAAPLVGLKGARVRKLMISGVNLLAYHLPLDAHIQFGNNACLGTLLGFSGKPISENALLWYTELEQPVATQTVAQWLTQKLQRTPTVIAVRSEIKKIAWCTGAAHSFITQAADAHCDAFISGEISEQTMHQAHELGISYFSAGHHATERYGVQALGNQIAKYFGLQHQFIDIDNPA